MTKLPPVRREDYREGTILETGSRQETRWYVADSEGKRYRMRNEDVRDLIAHYSRTLRSIDKQHVLFTPAKRGFRGEMWVTQVIPK